MLLVRLAHEQDIDDILALAMSANPPLTNLPPWREAMEARVAATSRAVSVEVDTAGPEVYMFVLEDTERNKVVGTATLRSWAGMEQAYYTYRRETLIHASPGLGIRREVRILALSHEISHATQLCAMTLSREYSEHPYAALLLRKARLAFIRQHPNRFSDHCAVAFTGVIDSHGESPFWNSVGSHFFGRTYADIHAMAGRESKSFIAEMMPQLPLYEELLTPEALAVIGQTHANSIGGYEAMVKEGFSQGRHVDIFDAGPVLHAETSKLKTIGQSCFCKTNTDALDQPGEPALISKGALNDFRAVVCPIQKTSDNSISMTPQALSTLAIVPEDQVLMVFLDHSGLDSEKSKRGEGQ